MTHLIKLELKKFGIAEKGKLTPYIDRIYSVYDTPKAIQYILTNHAQGKIVITMDF